MTDEAAHELAQEYWRKAKATFHAGGDYYERVATVLRSEVGPRMAPGSRVLDIGCGDGTFTAVLAEFAGSVDAYDLSPSLIDAARARGLANVHLDVGDAGTAARGSYDLVSCMGVLVCLIDEAAFEGALLRAAESVAPGGLFLLRETVSGWGRRIERSADYAVCYRSPGAYLDRLDALGFSLETDIPLATWSRLKRRSNHLWLLRAGPGG